MIVADQVVEQLVVAGVRQVFGVGGANIEDMFAAVQRRRPAIRAVLTKHEHGAGTAAAGYARFGGGIGVVMATSGGGAMNLVLNDGCRLSSASRAPGATATAAFSAVATDRGRGTASARATGV